MVLKNTKINSILIATDRLTQYSGTETYTYALIEELVKRDKYHIEYFTLNKGFLSDKIEKDFNIRFCSKKKYDLILANHHTCVDYLYRKGFIIQTCHGIYPQLEQPSPKADAYVAISQEVQEYLAFKNLPSLIILNGINLKRFDIKEKISSKVQTILSLCHSIEANNLIREICMEKGLEYIEAFKYKDPVWDVENKINQADLVIGIGRSAYEAMACGRPVIIYDKRSYFSPYGDGYIKNILGLSIQHNCSGRYSKRLMTKIDILNEIQKYNPEDSIFFRNFAERELNIKYQTDKYLEFYAALKRTCSKHSVSKSLVKIFNFK